MKKNFYLLLVSLLGLMGIISSCEDKETFPPVITFDETVEYSVKAKDTLWLRPEVKSALEANFEWFVNEVEVFNEKDFPFVQKEKGVYNVKFIATNTDGEVEKTLKVTVKELLPPVVEFDETLEYTVNLKDTLWFEPKVTSATEASYLWYVDDKEVFNEKDFPFAQKETGIYNVKFKVSNEDGEVTKNFQVRVKGPYGDGTFIVVEGNMSDQNGRLCFIDEKGNYTTDAYYKVNNSYIGNVLQDIYIHNGKIYMITQNGDRLGGDGRLVIANAETLEKERAINDGGMEDESIWPQHLVVIDDNKAYIRYSTSDMEQHSGIRILDIKAGTLSSEDIEGTYGDFTIKGSSKMRMVYTNEKVFAPCGHDLTVIDAKTDKIVKRIEFTSQIKGIVKGHDGNIWMTIAGDFTGGFYMPTYTSRTKVVGINSSTYEIIKEYELEEGFDLPVATWTPSIGMCASFTKDEIFFWNGPFTATDVYKFNYTTGEKTKIVDLNQQSGLGHTIYGYVGVDKKDNLYVGTTDYMTTKVAVFNSETGERVDLTDKNMDNDNNGEPDNYYFNNGGSPSGIDFTYRFEQ